VPQPLLAIERPENASALVLERGRGRADHRPVQAAAQGRDEIALRLGKFSPLQDGEALRHRDHRRPLVVVRDEDSITAEAALDGIYVLRTTIGGDELDAAGVISAYKDLAGVERTSAP